jgi:hypothetical protein
MVNEMPVKKLTVARGASISHDDESWDRVFYSIEAEVDETELQVAKAELQGMINAWIVDALAHPIVPASKAEAEQIPQIDLAELEELPWTSFQTKQSAKRGEAGWIFSNTEGAEELVKALEAKEGKLELAEYIFRFSGDQKQFISRSPVKTKKNPDNGWQHRNQTLKNIKEAGERLTGE